MVDKKEEEFLDTATTMAIKSSTLKKLNELQEQIKSELNVSVTIDKLIRMFLSSKESKEFKTAKQKVKDAEFMDEEE